MTHYVLKIYRRRRAGETVGWLDNKAIEFDAADLDAARNEARAHLGGINWETHFAALEGDSGKFVSFWTSENA